MTNDEEQDRKTVSYAYELLDRLASHVATGAAPSASTARQFEPASAAQPMPIRSRRLAAASKTSPVPAVITKIDRMKAR